MPHSRKHWLAAACLVLGACSLMLVAALFMAQRGANEAELRILQDGVECVAQQQNEHRRNSYAEQMREAQAHGQQFHAPAPAPLPAIGSVLAGACDRFIEHRLRQVGD